MSFELSDREKVACLQRARTAIESRLMGQALKDPSSITETLKKKCGAFVTLHKSGKLRGCIGYLLPTKPLVDTIQEVAVSSAFNDPRFPALEPEELEKIKIEISVLSPTKKIENIDEIQIGVHGIVIKSGYSSGLLLPQVAIEHNWDRETFLTNTCHKAGLPGNCWKQKSCQIEIFSAIVFSEEDLNLK